MEQSLKSKCVWAVAEMFWNTPAVRQLIFVRMKQIIRDQKEPLRPMEQMYLTLSGWCKHFFNVIDNLVIPLSLKQPLTQAVWAVGRQSFLWHHYHMLKFDIATERIYWLPPGIIDVRKTVRQILDDDDISLAKRLWLACHHCVKDFVEDHWTKELSSQKPPLIGTNEYSRAIMAYWEAYMTDDFSEIERMMRSPSVISDSYNAFMFTHCFVNDGCLSGSAYFWSMLTDDERRSSMIDPLNFLRSGSISVYDFAATTELKRYFIWYVLTDADRASGSDKLRAFILIHTLSSWPEELRYTEVLPHSDLSDLWIFSFIINMVKYRIKEGGLFHFGWPSSDLLDEALAWIDQHTAHTLIELPTRPLDELRRMICTVKRDNSLENVTSYFSDISF